MKNFFTMLLCLFFTAASFNFYNAEAVSPSVDISVNNYIIKTDSEPFIKNSLTYVPVRFVSEALGFSVSWDNERKAASIKKGAAEAVYYVGEKSSVVNGEETVMEAKAYNVDSRVFVPVRSVCEFLEASVSWNSELYIVDITSGHNFNKNVQKKDYTKDDIFWMSRIIESESGGEPTSGKLAVGNVVLNRVKSSEFPDTVYSVIFDKKYGVQFEPTVNGTIYNLPSYQSVSAAKRALNGENNIGECLYFLNPKIASSFWIVNNRQYYTTISNHDFYL